jgi:hypothetical protein
MMDELLQAVARGASLSPEQAALAVAAMLRFFTARLPSALVGELHARLGPRPLGCYRYMVRALGAGLWSDWSEPSGPFANPPRVPVVDAVRR